ncbi:MULTISPECIES: sensor histidine kinase [Agrobacterium]|uniref:sensor histidine kinase n=1 Tax=Agrobacterium TaxID=357 RepID=UPI00080F9C3C|nr:MULTISPECIES: HAMP domain-containing sensor histidine kinase [Agrobacterium]MEA1843763.1 HAMP domain-containing sensor histidine kinase [Agrobacterium tumefaciens]NTA44452.1 HAMP domain-containing histidine kinase [Agrobacterium tumefaciens]UZX44114.1 HAMP domain-containing histidine kinase [Agrobacterium sp. 13-2099-1-2]WCK21059.1 HAMP domain-containing sensor histidine kinase [Agrobacterium tumefaciens]WIE34615.1 HAMP domain-containing sensor histidine kinase [Agrobacterium tumefaciens]
MARPTSMTRKLVTALTSVVAISWFIACGLGVMVMQDEFAEIFDAGVEETAERLLPLLVDDLRENNTGPASQKLNQSAHAAEYLTYQVRDREGQVVLHSHDSSTEPFEVSLDPGFSETATQRIYTVATPDGNYFLQVADAFANRREAIEEAGTAILLPVLILIPASIFAVIFVVRKTLQPIQTLRDEIGKKDGGNLAPLETLPFPAELHPIARSVNLLLRRLRSTIEAEREFTANSAHELRTPIAGALAQAQRLHADIPPELAPRVENIEKALMHLGHLAEKLLQMSRAEARIGVTDTATDLIPILELIIDDMSRTAIGTSRIRFTNRCEGGLNCKLGTDAFGIIIRNLLENALIHSPPESPVHILAEENGTIRVVNSGAAIDKALLPKLTTRFVRGPSKADGTGLGLAIVRSLMEQIGGELVLSSPAPSRQDGFEARIVLPVEDA